MNANCVCGVRMVRADLVPASDVATRRIVYVDTDPLVAHWRCPSCGRTRQQRKRQAHAA